MENPDMDNSPLEPAETFSRRLKVIGVGGAGITIVNRLIASGMPATEFAAVSTDALVLASSAAPHKLLLESKRLRGLGTGGDPARGARAAEENLAQLEPLCREADMVFLVSGLGGGSGGGVCPVLARLARQAGALVMGFVVLPFGCEGAARGLSATRALEALKSAADGVICLPNDKILKLISENSSITEAFDKAGGLLAEGVHSVWRLVNLKGPIELNFEDLSAALRDPQSQNLFAVAEGSGAERVTEVLERLRAHPLLEDGKDLERAETVLVSVVGGNDLSMAEISRLMAEIHETCSDARVSMGVATSPEYAGRLLVTLIVSCPRPPRDEAVLEEDLCRRAGTDVEDPLQPHLPRSPGEGRTQRTTGSRCVPPPPELTPDRLQQAASRKGARRTQTSRLRQGQLPLEVISKGRFEKGEPTVLHGEDLDMPTYVRRGVALN